MTDSLLALLTLTPEQVSTLPIHTRSRLLSFLLDWEGYDDVLRCLACLNRARSLTLQDVQARALLGLGHHQEAVRTLEDRLMKKSTPAAQVLLARALLTARQAHKAQKLAEQSVQVGTNPAAWSLLGDVLLQRKRLDNAARAYLTHQQLAPADKEPLLGLMHVYQRQGDLTTASAYAVAALTEVRGKRQLTVEQLQSLLDFFQRIDDHDQSQTISQQLQQRFARELDALRTLLQEEPESPRPSSAPQSAISVSPTERADLTTAVRQLFGFSSFLPAQAEIMACLRRGEHVLAILPTGGGKSLCYQLPAFMDSGLSLVVSPLIALMKDQMDSLPAELRSQAIAINSSMNGRELEQALDAVARGQVKLVYAAPERLRQLPFLHTLRRGGLTRLVIDEAHCVSGWGHDFRPDYLHIARAHRDLGRPPILAVTATAPPAVREDIERQLFGKVDGNFRLIATDPFRPNLHLSAVPTANIDERLVEVLTLCQTLAQQNLKSGGIVYAHTRQRCEEIAALLRQHGLSADHYHAGLQDRAAIQERFMRNEVQIVVATVAFGMGVDKPDIRFILHDGLPNSVEAYYQEAGRAGRDGLPARCILVHSPGDQQRLVRHAKESTLSVEFLRQVYQALRKSISGDQPGAIALDDLRAALKQDETTVRVALGVLEQVALLRRDYDVPRTVDLVWLKEGRSRKFDHFCRTAALTIRKRTRHHFMDLAQTTGIPPQKVEGMLLGWQEQGFLQVYPAGRDLLLTVLPYPADIQRRMNRLLDRYATVQQQRATEMIGYATTRHCRHGHLASYLGGEARTQCGACDNCVGVPRAAV